MADLVQTWELWAHLKARLESARMQSLLGGAGRVYLVGDDFGAPEGGENQVWSRLVIVPTDTLWRTSRSPRETRRLGFLVRAETHKPATAVNFNPSRQLDAIQAEAAALLDGYVPADTLGRVRVALPLYLWTDPQPVPLYDQPRGLFFNSAEYRTEAVRKGA